MRWIKTFWLVGLSSLTAQAACVNGRPSVTAEFRDSKAVVLATVIGKKQAPPTRDGYFLDGTVYQVKVEKRFKGADSPTLEIFSENSSGRFNMTIGDKYLLFVYQADGRFSADNCGHSGLASTSASMIQQVTRLTRPTK
jgi:hypothetical protein